jgi:PEP-CTERM motif
MRKHLNVLTSCAVFSVLLASPAFAGKIVVFTDEWWSSNTGFATEGASGIAFTDNLVSAFGVGNYLIYSNNFGLTESSFDNRLTADGVTLTQSTTAGLALAGFKAVLLAGPIAGGVAPDNTALIAYVNGGGNVFVEGGTGFFGGAAGESAAWATFLNAYGLSFSTNYDTGGAIGCANYLVSSGNSLFAGVSQLYLCGGQQTFASGSASVIATTGATAPLFIAATNASSSVPEPSTFGMLIIGAGVLAGRRFGRKPSAL